MTATLTPANLHPALAEIQRLFDTKGTLVYGEDVNQLQHALQCGALAEQAGAAPALVVAAVLHDLGHMLHRDAAAAVQAGSDDRHEALGAKHLARWFVPAVSEPVRLHVQAKRCLCAQDPAYHAGLSPLSQRTLQIQGGPMSDDERRAFEQLPFAADAILLRRWDDLGKRRDVPTPPLQHYLALAEACLA